VTRVHIEETDINESEMLASKSRKKTQEGGCRMHEHPCKERSDAYDVAVQWERQTGEASPGPERRGNVKQDDSRRTKAYTNQRTERQHQRQIEKNKSTSPSMEKECMRRFTIILL